MNTPAEDAVRYAKQRDLARQCFWILFVVDVVTNALLPLDADDKSIVVLVFTVAAIIIILAWMTLDARSRDVKVSPVFKIGVVALAGLFVPIYLVRTRGWQRAGRSILIFLVQGVGFLLLAVTIVYLVTVIRGA